MVLGMRRAGNARARVNKPSPKTEAGITLSGLARSIGSHHSVKRKLKTILKFTCDDCYIGPPLCRCAHPHT